MQISTVHSHSVGISLKELGVRCRVGKCIKFCPGIEY